MDDAWLRGCDASAGALARACVEFGCAAADLEHQVYSRMTPILSAVCNVEERATSGSDQEPLSVDGKFWSASSAADLLRKNRRARQRSHMAFSDDGSTSAGVSSTEAEPQPDPAVMTIVVAVRQKSATLRTCGLSRNSIDRHLDVRKLQLELASVRERGAQAHHVLSASGASTTPIVADTCDVDPVSYAIPVEPSAGDISSEYGSDVSIILLATYPLLATCPRGTSIILHRRLVRSSQSRSASRGRSGEPRAQRRPRWLTGLACMSLFVLEACVASFPIYESVAWRSVPTHRRRIGQVKDMDLTLSVCTTLSWTLGTSLTRIG